jgi:uncharacterized protein DUF5663
MFQLDDQFLQSVGLGDLPEDQKEAFLQHTYETLEERVGTRLADSLSDDQLQEFEAFASQDEEKTYGWLSAHAADYTTHEEYKQLAESAPEGTAPLIIAAEYASIKWLEINSPNYRDVVAEELSKLRDEIIASRDHIGSEGAKQDDGNVQNNDNDTSNEQNNQPN